MPDARILFSDHKEVAVPHVIIELSRNVADRVDLAATVQSVHDALCETGKLPVSAIKSRLVIHDHFAVGRDMSGGFATALVRIQPGRPLEIEQEIGKAAFDALAGAFAVVEDFPVSVSVDVQLINREASFSKAG
ncbi:hypothetical protein [Devosia sp. 2618]|uniref:5-carboxymethyl-2-hydroxymuconate Delta-isomerase n=1 Tax=Devosia sp. 2618 TaxID=3156454 RepID=UPI0033935792